MSIKKFTPYSKVRKSAFFRAGKEICAKLQKNKFETFFVGGCVRDLLIHPHKLPVDIDIATSASPENILALFPSTQFVGEAFGVCLVKVRGFHFEVATFRVEGEYLDKRHPSFVAAGNLFQDSCRRDFTINSLYYNPCKRMIIDFHSGQRDIKNKLLRCVGNAQARFEEDALRVLRALRFSAQFKLQIEVHTKTALLKYSSQVQGIAKERILLEFSKVKNFRNFVKQLIDFLILDLFLPQSKFLEKRDAIINKLLHQSGYCFLDFLLQLSFYFKFVATKELISHLSLWPLTRKDFFLCQNYLQINALEDYVKINKILKEEAQFLLFLKLLKIYKMSKIAYAFILKNISLTTNDENFIELVGVLVKEKIEPLEKNIVEELIQAINQNHLPNFYIQTFLDYYSYKDVRNRMDGNKPHWKRNFVEENLNFICSLIKQTANSIAK